MTAATGFAVNGNLTQDFTWNMTAGTLSGHLYAANGTTGVCGANISANGPGGSAYGTTALDGSYSLSLPAGSYTVSVNIMPPPPGMPSNCGTAPTFPSYYSQGVSVAVSGSTAKDFSLPPTYTISGRVVAGSNTGMTGVGVSFSSPPPNMNSAYATTGSNGNYSVTVYGGTYSVNLSQGGFSMTAATGLAVNGNLTQDFTWNMTAGTLSGHLYAANGTTGVCGATISANGPGGSAYGTTALDGSYSLSLPAGSYTVS